MSVARDRLGGTPIAFDDIRVGDEIASRLAPDESLHVVGVVGVVDHYTARTDDEDLLAHKSADIFLLHRPEPVGPAIEPRDADEAESVELARRAAHIGAITASRAYLLVNEVHRLRTELQRVSETAPDVAEERAAALREAAVEIGTLAVPAMEDEPTTLAIGATRGYGQAKLKAAKLLYRRADEIERGER